jgi:chromosome segregation protein
VYLKELHIHGFKTFADKTQIVFTPGITCVIGPNGSGKSNISDAVLWVLGENNVRSLRGSSAQDVIFAGNDKRRPLGMAEVSLTLDNSTHILPLDFSEVTVTRRLYRSGDSEFFINKVSCRLKDLYELFLDTGVGRDAYSMINQGQIDQILSVRAEDRRAIFEEAAGIKKYRVRKKETERKLEHTQQNLLRVHDIVGEIEARLGPLQRQAAGAKRYRELATRLRVLENAWYGTRLKRLGVERTSLAELVRELNAERKRLEAELAQTQEAEKAARAALQQLDARADEVRRRETEALQKVAAAETERARAEERAGEIQRRLAALEKDLADVAARIDDQVRRAESTSLEEARLKREVDTLRGELGRAQTTSQEKVRAHEAAAKELERIRQAWLARERRQAEVEARLQSLEGRVKGQEQARARAVEALEDGEAELDRLTRERASFLKAADEQRLRSEALGKELDVLRQATRSSEQALSAARMAQDQATRAAGTHQARLQALTELGERGEGAGTGAKLVLTGVRRGQVRGKWSLLVEGLQAPAGLEKAVEAALGIYGDALLCDSEEAAIGALRWLRNQKASALVLVGSPQSAEPPLPSSLGELLFQGATPTPALQWAATLLGTTVLCDTLDTALAARNSSLASSLQSVPPPSPPPKGHPARLPSPTLWVTRDGQWLSRWGALSAGTQGAEGAAAATLARRRELERLQAEAPALESAAEQAREAVRAAEGESRKSQGGVREKQTDHEKARIEHQAQLREADRRKQDEERARHRVERLRQDVTRAEREQTSGAEALAAARKDFAALQEGTAQSPVTEGEAAVRQAQELVREAETARRAAETAVSELRVRLAEQDQRLQAALQAARRAVEAGSFLDRQRAERLNEQRTLVAEKEQRQLSFANSSQMLAEARGDVEVARRDAQELSARRQERTAAVDLARTQYNSLNARLRELMERCHKAEVELAAVDAQRRSTENQWVDAAVGAHNLELSQSDDAEEPLQINAAGLLEQWNAQEAELTLSSYSDPEGELGRLRRQIRSLGAINPDAPEQYAEAKERYDFLTSQRADLEAAREQLVEAIREIDLASRETFLRAFNEIASAFDEMFKKLFGGGTTELRLTDPEDILETGIDIIVQPPGKRQQNLLLLSGGERALTAAAMLFALLKVRPSPFCVMDEVDAPLDESNVGRFADTLREFSHHTQFIVVTHNRGTMERADTLYGVTMEERGVSKVLSCTLGDPVITRIDEELREGAAAWLEIDLNAYRGNLRALSAHAGRPVLAVVKANGYGHGLSTMAAAALEAGCAGVGVAVPEEGAELRDAGLKGRIVVLGLALESHADLLVEHDLEPVVTREEVLAAIGNAAARCNAVVGVHVKVDSGMTRVGIHPNDALNFCRQASSTPGLRLAGVATHFACSEEDDLTPTEEQWRRFEPLARELAGWSPPPVLHASNSAATLWFPQAGLDWVRGGLVTYGIPPGPRALPFPITPVASLKGRIVQVREVPAGVTVSYGGTWTAPRPSRLAVVPLGYGDGYPWALSNRGEALVRGQRVPIRGRVCMDQVVLDVTDLPPVQAGEIAVFIGRQEEEEITASEVAERAGTISYEILTRFAARLPRVTEPVTG